MSGLFKNGKLFTWIKTLTHICINAFLSHWSLSDIRNLKTKGALDEEVRVIEYGEYLVILSSGVCLN